MTLQVGKDSAKVCLVLDSLYRMAVGLILENIYQRTSQRQGEAAFFGVWAELV